MGLRNKCEAGTGVVVWGGGNKSLSLHLSHASSSLFFLPVCNDRCRGARLSF